jgi:hypothetical protein
MAGEMWWLRMGVVEHLFWRETSASWLVYLSGDAIIDRKSSVRMRKTSAASAALSKQSVTDNCGQALKGAWWMSWHREATKDVEACDKLRGAGKQALIRRFLNAETRYRAIGIILP